MPSPRNSKIGDPIRDMIRASVQFYMLQPGDPERPKLHPRPDSVVSITAKAVTPQATRITVELEVGAPRHFWVKVSEEW
jgi:hypothetical protein